jgi:hypothetical protein
MRSAGKRAGPSLQFPVPSSQFPVPSLQLADSLCEFFVRLCSERNTDYTDITDKHGKKDPCLRVILHNFGNKLAIFFNLSRGV